MNISLKEPITGHELIRFINSPKERRQPIVEGLIHEKSCVMFASHPGIGKSILLMQMCMEISAGLPVYAAFPSQSKRIYYIQKERPLDEVAERVEELQKHIPWNPNNLIIDSELQTFNLANEKNHGWIIERIARHNPDIVVIDPIGSGTPGLSQDEPANLFCNFLTSLQQKTGATNILAHHAVKDSYTKDGNKIQKEDPFYGSQWIKAHVTGSYYIQTTEHGRLFNLKKDSHSNLIEKFEVAYDHESMISTSETNTMALKDRAKMFITNKKIAKSMFTVKDLHAYLGCDIRTVRKLMGTPPFDEGSKIISRHKVNGSATLYEPVGSF